MAKKYDYVLVEKHIYKTYNQDGELEFHVKFKYKNRIYNFKNYTREFNFYHLEEKKHLKAVREKKHYVVSKLKEEGIYHFDKVEEPKEVEDKIAIENRKFEVLFDTQFHIMINESSSKHTDINMYNYNRHVKPYLGSMSVYDIKYKDINSLFDRMDDSNRNGTGRTVNNRTYEKKPLALQTQKNILSDIHKVFKMLFLMMKDLKISTTTQHQQLMDVGKKRKKYTKSLNHLLIEQLLIVLMI